MTGAPGKLSLSQLRAVEAVARLGSFSAAAKHLGVSQPSVSNQVHALETRFRARLIERTGYSTAPAPALEAILPQIRAVLSLCTDIEGALDQGRSLAGGALRVGYSTYQIAMPLISRFMAAYPEVGIEARALATMDVLALLEEGQIDIGFVTGRDLPAGLSGHKLLSTRIVLAAPPGHRLAGQGPLSWAEVAGLPLIQREASSGTRQIFEAAATVARIRVDTVLVLGSWGSITEMVRAGVGLGVVMAAEMSDRDGLVPIEIADRSLTASHFVVCQRDMARVATVQAMMTLALRED